MWDPLPSLRLEIVAVGEPRAEILAILRDYWRLAKAGKLVGLVLIGELPEGAYKATVSSTRNLAERIGRLELLQLDMVSAAREDGVELDEDGGE